MISTAATSPNGSTKRTLWRKAELVKSYLDKHRPPDALRPVAFLLSPIYLQDFLELISSCSLAISSPIVIVVVSPLSRSRTATVPSSASFAPMTSM